MAFKEEEVTTLHTDDVSTSLSRPWHRWGAPWSESLDLATPCWVQVISKLIEAGTGARRAFQPLH